MQFTPLARRQTGRFECIATDAALFTLTKNPRGLPSKPQTLAKAECRYGGGTGHYLDRAKEFAVRLAIILAGSLAERVYRTETADLKI